MKNVHTSSTKVPLLYGPSIYCIVLLTFSIVLLKWTTKHCIAKYYSKSIFPIKLVSSSAYFRITQIRQNNFRAGWSVHLAGGLGVLAQKSFEIVKQDGTVLNYFKAVYSCVVWLNRYLIYLRSLMLFFQTLTT